MQFKLKTMLFGFVFVAVCCLTYIHPSLWAGTILVSATVLLFATSTISAYSHRNHARLAFSIFGWAWLVLCLGSYGHTPKNTRAWAVPARIYDFFNICEDDSVNHDASIGSDGTMHSLLSSGDFVTIKTGRITPAFHNLIRLFICMTSIVFGGLGSLLVACCVKNTSQPANRG